MRAFLAPVVLFAALVPGLARAASRLVMLVDQPALVVLDGTPVNPAGSPGRFVVTKDAGSHQVLVRTLSGTVLSQSTIAVGDNAEATLHWTGVALEVSGATRAAPDAGRPLASSEPPPPKDPALVAANQHGDKKVSQPARSSDSSTNSIGSRVVGEAATIMGNTIVQSVTPVPVAAANGLSSAVTGESLGGTIVNSATYMVQNAQAGTRFGHSSEHATSQKITKAPAPVTGQVTLTKTGGGAMLVFCDGEQVASLGEGAVTVTLKLPVGQRSLEIWKEGAGGATWRGYLRVDENVSTKLVFSPDTEPTAPGREFAWAPI